MSGSGYVILGLMLTGMLSLSVVNACKGKWWMAILFCHGACRSSA